MAVTNITILEGQDQPPPPGWHKDPTDLNKGAGGAYLYLAFETDGSEEAVSDIYFLLSKEQDPPDGYIKIDTDLNKGAGGAYIYLTFTRTADYAPIQYLTVVSSSDPNANAPDGYTRIDVDLNKGAGGKYIYLCYRK
ncbi:MULTISPECIES: hypothetical protein [Actinomadura]|uniref:MABP domain-containing protein n=1 Tax=Actinomadura litoris TaxID=2678616 RepID=A0A7K1LDK4_9ACTN|nr:MULTISPECIES: hypothetical protein [Actinomadura]MBT2210226.1 hypothetical protein [Actinomadura sp. NEAU-AAG7]MUN42510.1 hypothetical protein [Actinomadura litoris]